MKACETDNANHSKATHCFSQSSVLFLFLLSLSLMSTCGFETIIPPSIISSQALWGGLVGKCHWLWNLIFFTCPSPNIIILNQLLFSKGIPCFPHAHALAPRPCFSFPLIVPPFPLPPVPLYSDVWRYVLCSVRTHSECFHFLFVSSRWTRISLQPFSAVSKFCGSLLWLPLSPFYWISSN